MSVFRAPTVNEETLVTWSIVKAHSPLPHLHFRKASMGEAWALGKISVP